MRTAPYVMEKEELEANFNALASHLNEDKFTEFQLRMIRLKVNEIWAVIERRAVKR